MTSEALLLLGDGLFDLVCLVVVGVLGGGGVSPGGGAEPTFEP